MFTYLDQRLLPINPPLGTRLGLIRYSLACNRHIMPMLYLTRLNLVSRLVLVSDMKKITHHQNERKQRGMLQDSTIPHKIFLPSLPLQFVGRD